MYGIVHSSALALCTPAIIWLSFRQSCFCHDLEISIALAILTGNNQDSVDKNSSETFLCLCVGNSCMHRSSGRNLHHMSQSRAAYLVSYSTAGNVSLSTLLSVNLRP